MPSSWSPALGEIKKSGKVLTDAAEVGQWGAPTFEVWVARKDFAEKHPEVIAKFAKVSLDSFADYNAHKAEWTADSERGEEDRPPDRRRSERTFRNCWPFRLPPRSPGAAVFRAAGRRHRQGHRRYG